MRLVFMGTPEFSVPCLEALADAGHEVTLVVTQPDRPKGRGRKLQPTPVKAAALARNIDVFQPDRPNRPENVERIRAARPGALVVVAYGAILKPVLLELAPHGAINVHASLLPKYRGMSPIQRAIWNGDAETGVTTMHMDEGVDTGDMILRESLPIGPDETSGELHDRLALMGARLIVETLRQVEAGTAPRRPQEGESSYAPRIDKQDGLVDWALPAGVIHDHARAMTPWPGATAFLQGRSLLVARTRRVEPEPDAALKVVGHPGTILAVTGDALRVACGAGLIDLVQVRPPGSGTMTGAEYARGRHLGPGARFEQAPATWAGKDA